MKAWWLKLENRIDALSLRERSMVFLVAALVLVTLFSTVVIDPLAAREKVLSQQMKQDRQQVAALQTEIQARVNAHRVDPDAASRSRLQQLQRESGEIREQLKGMQNGQVAPEQMTAMLQDLLRRDSGLQLRSLRTLPVTVLNEAVTAQVASGAAASQPGKDGVEQTLPRNAVYKHGVQLVVQGGYLDLMRYLSDIEGMPWEIFWEKASLEVNNHPSATLTLTLFTLSLDKKWLNI